MKLGSIAVMCATLAALVLSGCSKPGVVGTWNGTIGTQPQVKIGLTLSKDAKFQQTTEFDVMGKQNIVLASGTYTAKDNVLALQAQSLNVNGAAGTPPNKESAFNYKLDGDTITLTKGKMKDSIVLKRAKE